MWWEDDRTGSARHLLREPRLEGLQGPGDGHRPHVGRNILRRPYAGAGRESFGNCGGGGYPGLHWAIGIFYSTNYNKFDVFPTILRLFIYFLLRS